MATVVLTAVGSYFGGPIGGAIGAALGGRIDQAIFGSGKPREGPRINELHVQTSSYGTQIPAIFGAMRVAGSVIWSTDLIEHRAKSSGGKGRPATINYSYSASFAVAVSSRPVARIGRIWADGNLLRGAAGDFKVETGYRFHPGFGDQPPDPLLASAETSGHCPAYRGLAYAVFEDLQLADFGNRIPSLTFEIFERELAVPITEIARAASHGLIAGDSAATLAGYAVQGSDIRSALQPIFSSLPVTALPSEDRMEVRDWVTPSDQIAPTDPAVRDGATRLDRPGRTRASQNRAPTSISIRHYDPARDFQAGVQRSRQVGTAKVEEQIDFPAAVGAEAAREWADLQQLQRWRGLNGASLSLPLNASPIRAGAALSLNGTSAPLRVIEIEHQRGTTRIAAVEWAGQPPINPVADPGRNQAQPDLTAGTTRVILSDLPAFGSDDPGRAQVVVAAAGTEPGWRRAALSLQDGGRIIELGGTNGIATLGRLLDGLAPHTPLLRDTANQPVIRLLHDGMTLPPGTGDPTSFDAPLLSVGGEFLRYGLADKVGARDYRLLGLLRGCYGSGDSIAAHTAGTDVLLLEQNALLLLDAVPTPIGQTILIEALGMGDDVPVEASIFVSGLTILPRKPVHGRLTRQQNGDLWLQWVRRDRLWNSWSDGADIANSEGEERYLVELSVGGPVLSRWEASTAALLIPSADFDAVPILPGSRADFAITQLGRFARSAPLLLSQNL